MRIVLRPGALNIYGPAFKRAREALGLTQDALAARITTLGLVIDRTIVSRIENQKRILSDIEFMYFFMALRLDMDRFVRFQFRHPRHVPDYDEIAADQDDLEIKVAEDVPDPDDEFPYN